MVFINNDGSITSNAAAPNQDGPSADDFAMKVYTRFMMTTVLTMNDPNAAAARVLSEAFDKVRAEERARMQSAAPDEVVEAAAIAIMKLDPCGLTINGEHVLCCDPKVQGHTNGYGTPLYNEHCACREEARTALTAAIPAIKAQVLAEIVAWLRMGEHVHSRSGSIESERVFKLIADALERGEHEND